MRKVQDSELPVQFPRFRIVGSRRFFAGAEIADMHSGTVPHDLPAPAVLHLDHATKAGDATLTARTVRLILGTCAVAKIALSAIKTVVVGMIQHCAPRGIHHEAMQIRRSTIDGAACVPTPFGENRMLTIRQNAFSVLGINDRDFALGQGDGDRIFVHRRVPPVVSRPWPASIRRRGLNVPKVYHFPYDHEV